MRWRINPAFMYLIPLVVLLLVQFTPINLPFPIIHQVNATPETLVSVSPSNVINDTLTPKSTLILRPDGDGTFLEWTGTPTDSYDDWDDVTPDDDSSHFYTTAESVYQSSTLENHTAETWSISRVKVCAVARGDSNACQLIPLVVIGGWEYEGRIHNLTTTYSTYTSEWGMNPRTSEYWSWDDVDALEAAVESYLIPSGNETRVTQIYVEVSGSRLTVDITVDDVENLRGFQFELSFNPEVIRGVWMDQYYGGRRSFVLGPFLGSGGGLVSVAAGIGWNNTLGKLFLGLAAIIQSDPAYCPDGDGVLATVIFTVVGKGETEIHLDGLTGLKDPQNEWIIKGRDYVVDGSFRNVESASIPSVSFGATPVDTPVPLEGYNTTFTAIVSGGTGSYDTYKWYFWTKYHYVDAPQLDGPVVTTSTPSHNYTRRGSWNVTLTVIDSAGVVGTQTGYILIRAHDVYITKIATNTTRSRYPVGVNTTLIDKTVQINVTATNQGDFPETFDVTCFWDCVFAGTRTYYIVGTQYGIALGAGASTILNFYWDTTGRNVTHATYHTIRANASRVQYEYDIEWATGKIAPNQFTCGDSIRVQYHDMVVTTVATNATIPITPGDTVQVSATIKNEGDFNETDISVTAYYDESAIGTELIPLMTNGSFASSELEGNDTTTVRFNWDTTGISTPSAYRISVKVHAVTDEYDITDNTLFDGTVRWPDMPEASFTYEPSQPVVGELVSFDASASDATGDISYGWDFGDGETDSGVTVDHEYAAAGPYNVTLTVNNGTNSDTEKKMLIVYPVPTHDVNVVEVTASPAYPPDRVTVGDRVTIGVEVSNEGNVGETFSVDVSYDSASIETRPGVVLSAGATKTLTFSWNTLGVSPDVYTINATVPPVPDEEEIGDNTATFSSVAFIDETPPSIGTPSREPAGDVMVDQDVTVSVSVTDAESGVKNVTLSYTTNNVTWTPLEMTYNPTSGLYEATIDGQAYCTWVKYEIIAYDNAENLAVEDNAEEYYVYHVIPEFPSVLILPLILILTALAAISCRLLKPHLPTRSSRSETNL